MWFEKIMGFKETLKNVRDNIEIEGDKMISKVNGKTYQFGELEIPNLGELRVKSGLDDYDGNISVKEVVGDIQVIHHQNEKAVFQSASQFNLLEMAYPELTPENGVDIYETDYTQGPACAIACGAGTIYRNYFTPTNGEVGQTKDNQIDCLKDVGDEMGGNLWEMRNGYALIPKDSLLQINKHIGSLTEEQREDLKSKLKVGIQWDTEFVLTEEGKTMTQVYCSALPVSYNHGNSLDLHYWESFAKLILEATYEATFHTALLNHTLNGSNKVFLTLVGGGAFGNRIEWIVDSIEKVVNKFKNTPLEVSIVSYGKSNPNLNRLIT